MRTTLAVKRYRPDETDEILDLVDLGVRGKRMVEGLASTATEWTKGLCLDTKGAQLSLPTPLLCAHGRVDGKLPAANLDGFAVGQVTWAAKTARGLFIRAVMDDGLAADKAWHVVQSGGFNALSIRFVQGRLKGVVDDVKFYDRWTLAEVSICKSGSNPDCHFRVLNRWTQAKAVRTTVSKGRLPYRFTYLDDGSFDLELAK